MHVVLAPNRVARKTIIPETDQADLPCPDPFEKIFRFAATPNQIYIDHRPVPLEGRLMIVTIAGRDAVDADAPITNGTEADGEVVWS